MTEPIVLSAEEVHFIADTKFFLAKARISAKIRRILEQVHEALRSELKGKALLVPGRFTLDAFQFVKGEHLENFSYQYLDFPRFYSREEKFSFRTLFWWGHHVVFALIIEGGHLRSYKQNLMNRYSEIADHGVCLCLGDSLWEWKRGPGYTLEITRERKTEVAAVLAHRPFFKLARFVPMNDPAVSTGGLVSIGREALQAVLPVITT